MRASKLLVLLMAIVLVGSTLTVIESRPVLANTNALSTMSGQAQNLENFAASVPRKKKSKYMSKSEAAQHYLSLVCPVNAAYAAWNATPTFGPEYDAAVQEVIRTSTEAANGFKNPPKKWPKNVKKAWVTWFYDKSVMEAWALQMFVGANEATQPTLSANYDTYTWEWFVAKKSRSDAYRDWFMNPYWEWTPRYPNLFRKKLGLPPAQGDNDGCP